ncbi:hypothetical protein STAQ_41730 [Allostella sp. ATCC 35155]|nr:hypothetical protein STAQ_41730 [Stella sp. ATCC 35155]
MAPRKDPSVIGKTKAGAQAPTSEDKLISDQEKAAARNDGLVAAQEVPTFLGRFGTIEEMQHVAAIVVVVSGFFGLVLMMLLSDQEWKRPAWTLLVAAFGSAVALVFSKKKRSR